jgi:hypothetical protein
MAIRMRGFDPGNQFPKAECKLYARSMPIMHPVGLGYKLMLSVV